MALISILALVVIVNSMVCVWVFRQVRGWMRELEQKIADLKAGVANSLGRIETVEKNIRELSTMASRLREDRQANQGRAGGPKSWLNFVTPIRQQAEEAPIRIVGGDNAAG